MNCLHRMKLGITKSVRSYWTDSGTTGKIEKIIKDLPPSAALDKLFGESSVPVKEVRLKARKRDDDRKVAELFKLLLYSGYLTRIESTKIYAFPNNEVKKYFYKYFFPNWFISQVNLNGINKLSDVATLLTNNLENFPQYLSIIQEELLQKINQSKLTESTFHTLLGGISMFASTLLKFATHNVYSEVQNQFSKKADMVFKPKDQRSNTYIIHEYKKLDNEAGIQETLENTIWQIYSQKYLCSVLSDMIPRNETIIISTRAIVFYKSNLDSWFVKGEEFRHSLDQARHVDGIFSNIQGGILENSNILSGTQHAGEKIKQRDIFLQSHGYISIYELLRAFSIGESIALNENKEVIRKEQRLAEAGLRHITTQRIVSE